MRFFEALKTESLFSLDYVFLIFSQNDGYNSDDEHQKSNDTHSEEYWIEEDRKFEETMRQKGYAFFQITGCIILKWTKLNGSDMQKDQ